LLDARSITALQKYHTIPTPIFAKFEDGIPRNTLTINIYPVISGGWSDTGRPWRLIAVIPPSGLRNSSLTQDTIECLPGSAIVSIPKFESLFQVITSMVAQAKKEIWGEHISQALAILCPHR